MISRTIVVDVLLIYVGEAFAVSTYTISNTATMINHKITTSIRGFAAAHSPLLRAIISAMPKMNIVTPKRRQIWRSNVVV